MILNKTNNSNIVRKTKNQQGQNKIWWRSCGNMINKSTNITMCCYQILSFTSPSNNHQEEVGCSKPKSACPKRFKRQERNKTNIKCALCSGKSRGLGTEINNSNGPGYKVLHVCYVEKQSMVSKC